MIIKFLSRKSNSGQLIQYICRYIFNEEKLNKTELPGQESSGKNEKFLIKHNVRARTLKGFVREFNENEAFRLVRRKDSVKIFHTIISFSPKDRNLVTDKVLKDIAYKFIEERGLNCLYVGTKHLDKDAIHIHLCSSGTQLNGRSARVSNQKFRSIKLALERYQHENFPFLINSKVEHGHKGVLSKDELLATIKANRQVNKEKILEILEREYGDSTSKAEFLQHIKERSLEPYFRNGQLQGVLYEGKTKFRFSKLGFNEDRLELLGKPREVDSKTPTIPKLRDRADRDVQSPKKKDEPQLENKPKLNTKENSKLLELAAIRNRSRVNEIEFDEYQRDKDLDHNLSSFIDIDDETGIEPLSLPILKQLPIPNNVFDTT